ASGETLSQDGSEVRQALIETTGQPVAPVREARRVELVLEERISSSQEGPDVRGTIGVEATAEDRLGRIRPRERDGSAQRTPPVEPLETRRSARDLRIFVRARPVQDAEDEPDRESVCSVRSGQAREDLSRCLP